MMLMLKNINTKAPIISTSFFDNHKDDSTEASKALHKINTKTVAGWVGGIKSTDINRHKISRIMSGIRSLPRKNDAVC